MRGLIPGVRPWSGWIVFAWMLSPSLAALGGCGSSPPATPEAQLPPPPPPAAAAPKPPAAASAAARPAATAGLTPLPTTQQVLAAIPEGRTDPFAPVRFASAAPAAATASAASPAVAPAAPAPLTLPEGFQFNGVISVRGTPQAIVQYGAESGSLFVGDRGGQGTPLLPRGWSVAAIDVQSGRLTLVTRQNTPRGQRITAQL